MKSALLFGWIALIAIVTFASTFTISETEQVVITQFGRPVGGVIASPGLHLKTPFVQEVHRFDK
ncbi:MAG TPA: SPFH domain-containing protein, partial [Candidatus Polarisedimenticolia bacterium]|nr:SPFH domain-containing protein [Candidatus Polarisedimenticolia bacterium]